MRTDNYQSSCFNLLFHMVIELLFTGEVYQYKDLRVFLAKNTCCEVFLVRKY